MTAGGRTGGRASARARLAVPLAAALVAAAGAGCALRPPVAGAGEAVNLALSGELAYVALGEAGLGVYDLRARRMTTVVPPDGDAASVDDLALADGFLFALDARAPGHLSAYALAEPARPRRLPGALTVPVEPFSGVSADGGRVVVSGGTKVLTVARYGADGALHATGEAELGRGQPDVLVAPGGAVAYVSTHFSLLRATYGITALALDAPPRALSALEIEGAGFVRGAAKPASFALEAALEGTTLFVASGAGLTVVDVSDPAALRTLGTLALPVTPVNVDVRDGVAALVGSAPTPALVLVDVRRPAEPRLLSVRSLSREVQPTAVALDGERIVIAGRAAGVLVLDRGDTPTSRETPHAGGTPHASRP
ncbi:MAG: hypothetical protein QM704_01805 [Anaeromyxobacteraceae bacterium]